MIVRIIFVFVSLMGMLQIAAAAQSLCVKVVILPFQAHFAKAAAHPMTVLIIFVFAETMHMHPVAADASSSLVIDMLS